MGFPGGSVVKNLPARQDTWVQSLDQKISWRRNWQPTPVFLLGEIHGQRSLLGYSPWDCTGLDTTEATNIHTDDHRTHTSVALRHRDSDVNKFVARK